MVIISATICDKSGKILVARQYQNITKMALEENIKNFPKSIISTQQHTFVENNNLRYVYLPIDVFYLVLLTNKNSNMIEDLETIRLLHKLVLEQCSSGVSEATILKKSLDIVLCFDDVISFGYRESVTFAQVNNSLEMESSEEKLHNMLLRARENEAKDKARKFQQDLDKKKEKVGGGYSGMGGSSYQSGSSGSVQTIIDDSNKVSSSSQNVVKNEILSAIGGGSSSSSTSKGASKAPKKGMQLFKKKDQSNPAQAQNPLISAAENNEIAEIKEDVVQEKKNFNPLREAIDIEIVEKLTCNLTKEGGLTLFELIGEVFLTVNDSSKGCCQIEMQHQKSKDIVVKPIPVLNKNLWNDKAIIAMKDPQESFVPGEQISTLKYKYTSTSVDDLPFTFTYWFNKGVLTLEVEFNSNQTKLDKLENIDFLIKYPAKEVPEIRTIENGEQLEGPSKSSIVWRVLSLDGKNSSSNISIKFSNHLMIEELFPISVSFSTNYNYYKMAVKQALNLKDNSPLTFDTKKSFLGQPGAIVATQHRKPASLWILRNSAPSYVMLFQIIFFITLSAISLFGSSFILNTRTLYAKEKYFLISAIAGLFSAILILNEYQHTKLVESPLSIVDDIQRKFFYFNWIDLPESIPNYGLPQIKDGEAHFETIFSSAGYNISFQSTDVFFLGLFGNKDTGVRSALRSFIKSLHEIKVPVLYLEPKSYVFSLSDWESHLEFQNIQGLRMAIENFNRDGVVPSIVINDDGNRFFPKLTDQAALSSSEFFQILRRLFEETRVKIILVASSEYILRTLFSLGSKDLAYAEILQIDLLKRELVSTYITQQLMPMLNAKDILISGNEIEAWDRNLGFNYWLLHQFFASNSSRNYTDFELEVLEKTSAYLLNFPLHSHIISHRHLIEKARSKDDVYCLKRRKNYTLSWLEDRDLWKVPQAKALILKVDRDCFKFPNKTVEYVLIKR